jgi:hypothetical protein
MPTSRYGKEKRAAARSRPRLSGRFGNPAVSERPVAFRPGLAAGLAFSLKEMVTTKSPSVNPFSIQINRKSLTVEPDDVRISFPPRIGGKPTGQD